jgi:hypothetical protein
VTFADKFMVDDWELARWEAKTFPLWVPFNGAGITWRNTVFELITAADNELILIERIGVIMDCSSTTADWSLSAYAGESPIVTLQQNNRVISDQYKVDELDAIPQANTFASIDYQQPIRIAPTEVFGLNVVPPGTVASAWARIQYSVLTNPSLR